MSLYRARYVRWQDRLLARFWPPKRRNVQILQVLVDSFEHEIRSDLDRAISEMNLYGSAFVVKKRKV